jgi:integrase
LAKSTYESYQRLWNIHLKKAFGSKKVSQVTVDSVRRFHKHLSDKPYCANKSIVFLKAMYNYVIQEGYYKGINPAKGVRLNKEEARVRYLEHAELERFFNALNEVEESVSRNAILMLLYTGVRKSNALAMKWSEVDLDAKVWLIPKTKTGKNLTIALADSAVELLNNIKSNNPDEVYVFPSATSKSGHLEDIKRVWATIKKKANISNLRTHDLRHNLATYMIAQGASPFVVQRALTHKSIKSTQVYVNLGVEHLRDKLNETVNTLQRIGKKKGK